MGWTDYLNIGQMSGDVMFGLKIVALVMLYGYMHMNLGGGILSTAMFAVFGYYLLFYAQGMLAIIMVVVFFLMVHGFDILWGGDITRGIVSERSQARMMQQEMQYQYLRPPPV